MIQIKLDFDNKPFWKIELKGEDIKSSFESDQQHSINKIEILIEISIERMRNRTQALL